METLTGSLSKLTKNMQTAQSGTGAQADAFAALGVSINDTNGEMRSNQDVFSEAISALGKMENETQRDALAMQLFGKSAQDLNPLILGGADALKELGDEAEAAGLILSQDSLDSLNTLSDAMDTFKATMSGAGNLFATAFAEPMAAGMKEVTGFAQRITKAFSEGGFEGLSDELGGIISDVVAKLSEILPKVIEFGVNMIQSIVDGLQQNLPILIEGAMSIITMLTTAMLDMLPQLISMGMQIITQIMTGIAEAIPLLLPQIAGVITQIVQALVSNAPMLITAALALIQGLADGVLAAIPVLIDALPELITGIIDTLLEAIPELMQAGIDLLTSLVDALPDIIETIIAVLPEIIDGIIISLLDNLPVMIQAGIDLLTSLVTNLPTIIITVVKAIPEIIGGIIDALVNNIPMIIQAGIDLLTSLVTNLPQIILGVVSAVPEIIKAVVEAIISYYSELAEVGGNLIKGLWEGIKNMGAWIADKIKGFFTGIVDGIKAFLGIASPSKLFAGIGGFMAEGLGDGFTEEMKDVEKQINNSIPTSVDMPTVNQAEIVQQQTAAMVNAFGTLAAGMQPAGGGDIGNTEVIFKIDSTVFARVLLPALRQISGQLPEIIPDF
jgi:hypothetical protein